MNFSLPISLTGAPTQNLGTQILPQGVRYTAWAPERKNVTVAVQSPNGATARVLPLQKSELGYFSTVDPNGKAGDRYSFTVDGTASLPDLASRYQPEGLSGPSMVIDPTSYIWRATGWKRPRWQGHVVYELHVGTFTQEGTFSAALERIDYLADLGITVIELMPVSECTGERNWGYDGVLLFAPYHAYGTPDDMRTFIDACHARGLAVMLDVVYNHIGAIGDSTDAYSKYLSHPENTGTWGKSFNLDGEHSAPVRHLLLQNIHYWLEEFRIDGFRLDATHAIRDESEKHLLVQAAEIMHAHGAFSTAEDDRNTAEILKPLHEGGWALDAVWSDDFHHAMRVSQTKEDHSYLGRYSGSLQEIAETLEHGWYFRGQYHPKSVKSRGTSCNHLSPECFVDCISNHDQVGNRPFGERLHQTIAPDAYRALSLFFCLIPYTPLLFMGQEWAATSPFLFFTDHPGHFGSLVSEGRKRDFKFDTQKYHHPLPDCQAETTFLDSKLKWNELGQSPCREVLSLYREALQLRRNLFGSQNPPRSSWTVKTTADLLSITYQLSTRRVEIILSITSSDRGDLLSRGRPLLSSSDERFGGTTSDVSQTLVFSN